MAEPKNKTEAKAEIARLRSVVTRLQGLVPERQTDGTVLYFPSGAGSPGVTKSGLDSLIAKYTQRIDNLNTKFFAEAPVAQTPPGGSPGGQAPASITQLEKNVRSLENARRNDAGDYWVNGKWVLPAEYTATLDAAKKRLETAQGMAVVGGQQARETAQQTTMAAAEQSIALGQTLVQLQTKESYVDQVIATSGNRDDVTRARAWKKDIQKKISTVQKYLDKLNKTKTVDPTFVAPVVPTDQQLAESNPAQTATTPTPAPAPVTSAPTVTPAPTPAPTRTVAPTPSPVVPDRVSDATAPGIIPPSTPTAGGRGSAVNTVGQPAGMRPGTTAPVVASSPAPTTPTTPTTLTGQTPAGTPTVPGGGPAGGSLGGTPGGAVPPAGTPAAPAAPATGTWNIPADWETAAREAYGVYYDVIKNIPELRDFVNKLMNGPELSNAQFMTQLQQTNWWKTTTASAREFARRQIEDPATLQTQIDNQKAALRQQALDRGLTVNDTTLTQVVTDQIKFGWSAQVTLDYLGQQSLGTTEGAARLRQGFYGQQVRETAGRYGIPLSDATFTSWVAKIATGSENMNSFEAYVRDQAKVLYPALSNGLDRGLSFQDLTGPYAVQASRILEIPAEQIDFSDPRWARAFTSRNDKGEQTQMSFGEWADYLRSDPSFGWEYTDQAKNQAYDIALEIGRMFGRAG